MTPPSPGYDESTENRKQNGSASTSMVKPPSTLQRDIGTSRDLPCRKRVHSPDLIRSPSRNLSTPKRSKSTQSPTAPTEQQISFLDVNRPDTSNHSTPKCPLPDKTTLDFNRTEDSHASETLNPTCIKDLKGKGDDGDSDEDEDNMPLSGLGWPDTFDDDFGDRSRRNSLNDLLLGRRSLLSDSAMSSDFGDDRKQRRSFLEALLDAEEEEASLPRQRPHEGSMPNFYDDEVDAFFSSTVDDTLLPEQPSNLKPTTFITHRPNFLTADYFNTHGPNDRFYEEDNTEPDYATPYFDANYLILDQLGSGEYSNVWKVRKLDTEAIFAVKKTKVPFGSYTDRWQQIVEVDHLRAVQDSQHCVDLVDAWEQGGHLYIQMELCKSGSLQVFLKFRDGRVDEELIWNILYEIALGVKDIHQANIIHLDLKPSNVLIDSLGALKVGDFGLSVRWPADANEIKGEGDRRYMAPDLLREQFDKPADIFSLGLMVLEMAAGIVLPDTGESWETLRLGDFTDMDQGLSNISKEMRDVVTWMLTPNPKSRPTIEEILDHEIIQKVAKQRQESKHGLLHEYVPQLEALSEQPSQPSRENTYSTPDTKRDRPTFAR